MAKSSEAVALTCRAFISEVEGQGSALAYCKGFLNVYVNGAWEIVTEKHDDWLDPIMMRLAEQAGVEFGAKHKSLRRTLEVMTTRTDLTFDETPWIALPNGTLDPGQDNPKPSKWSKEDYITKRMEIPYVKGAECPQWMAMLRRMLQHPDRNEAQVEEMIQFLKRWTGVNIIGPRQGLTRPMQCGLIVEGVSGTGKSALAAVLRHMLGPARVVSPDVATLGTQFGLSVLLNAQAIITDDAVNADEMADPKILKKLVTGETISVDRKFKEAVQFQYMGAIMFTTNQLPVINDSTDAVYNRFRVLRMDHVFTPADIKKLKGMKPVEFLEHHKEFPGILNWALEGFREAYDDQGIAIPAELRQASAAFRAKNDAVYSFVVDCVELNGKVMVPAEVMAALAVEHSATHHQMSKLSMKKAGSLLSHTVREVYPDVKHETIGGNHNIVNYLGVGLTDLGLAHWHRVKDKKLAVLEGVTAPTRKIAA